MNIVTEKEPTTEFTPDKNKNSETKTQPQLVHIIVQDRFGADHHLWLFTTPEAEVAEDDEFYAEKKAKARKNFEDRVKNKAQKHLSHKRADMATIKILTQAEWGKSQEAGKKSFYVLYQNGTRRFISIRAESEAQAEKIFNQRISRTWPKKIFSVEEFKPLLEKSGWRNFLLPEICPN